MQDGITRAPRDLRQKRLSEAEHLREEYPCERGICLMGGHGASTVQGDTPSVFVHILFVSLGTFYGRKREVMFLAHNRPVI